MFTINFRQIESFVAIAKHGSFTRAAKELYLTQPTLTGHVQALETQLGTVLLNRRGKTVTLTEAGKILYKQAMDILNMREQTIFSMARYEGKLIGELAVAASTVPQKYLLPPLLSAFTKEYPDISYIIKQYDSKSVFDGIVSGTIDFGFVGAFSSNPEFEIIKLVQDRLILITSCEKKLQSINENTVTWNEIKGEKFILREEGSATKELFINSLLKRGFDAKELSVIASIESPDTIKQCVREGLGVAVVSEISAEEDIRLGLLKGYYISDFDIRRDFYFVSHKNRPLSPTARAFREFILKTYEIP